jgi:hypothetical protein
MYLVGAHLRNPLNGGTLTIEQSPAACARRRPLKLPCLLALFAHYRWSTRS